MGKTEKIKKSTLGTKFYFHRCKFIMNLSQIIDIRNWLIIFPMEMNHFGGKKYFFSQKIQISMKNVNFWYILQFQHNEKQMKSHNVYQMNLCQCQSAHSKKKPFWINPASSVQPTKAKQKTDKILISAIMQVCSNIL